MRPPLDGRARDPDSAARPLRGRRLLFVINEAYFLLSHRLATAEAARDAGLDVHVAAPPDHVWAPDGFEVSQLANAGFTYHAIPLSRRGTNPLAELRTLAALIFLYRNLRPDVVHLVTIKPNLYGGIAARITSVPAVVYAVTGLGHVFSAHGPVALLIRAVVSMVMRVSFGHRNAQVVFQNAADRKNLVDLGVVRPDRSLVIGGAGVDLAHFRLLRGPPGIPLVVLAARLIWEKGIQEFVDAARQLRSQGVVARFALVGRTHSSNPRAVPEAQLLAWRSEGLIEWWGFREDMAGVLSEAAVVCLPSKYGEGVPKILLEAAACGRAVVTTNIPGCADAVVDGVTGLIVPAGDAAALAEALRALVVDPSRRAAMGIAARARAEAGYDQRAVAAQTLSVYSSLLASSGRSRMRPQESTY